MKKEPTPREVATRIVDNSCEENLKQRHLLIGEIERAILAERAACVKEAARKPKAHEQWDGGTARIIAAALRARPS